MFCFILVVYFFLKKKFVHSELARQAGAKGHARAIPGHGTLRATQTRPAKVIQRLGTGGPCRMARTCCLRRKSSSSNLARGDRAACDGFFCVRFPSFSLIFLLLPHLFSLYEG